MKPNTRIRLLLLIAVCTTCPVTARNRPDANQPDTGQWIVTHHSMQTASGRIDYVATAGYMTIRERSGEPLADLFFVAYERENGSAIDVNRPISFAFNGGPGSSAVWLHMGGLGPKRVVLAKNGTALPRVDRLVDNEYTWLEFTDLVFVDPVGTGYSRAAPGVKASQFYAVQKDVETASAFVRLFVTEFGRWLSPQFIVGESYGTTRAVGMTRYLQEHDGLYMNGLVLMSSALDMGVISVDSGHDLPYVLSLPSYAAVALYHGKLGDWRSSDMARLLDRVKAWALDDYIVALAQGASLSESRSREVAKQLSQYTGLSQDFIMQDNLRVSRPGFIEELLSRQGRVLGLLDGRVTTERVESNRQNWVDPAFFLVKGPFAATFSHYVRIDLGLKTDRPYILLSEQANQEWDWGSAQTGYLNVAPKLAQAMSLDDRLRVFGAAGYYDLTTPYLSQEYVFEHLGLAPNLRSNLTFKCYPSGHQIYTSLDALAELQNDVGAFMAEWEPSGRWGGPDTAADVRRPNRPSPR